MTTSSILICPACGSMDISEEEVTIDGVTESWHVCQDCLFEWPVIPSSLSSPVAEEVS